MRGEQFPQVRRSIRQQDHAEPGLLAEQHTHVDRRSGYTPAVLATENVQTPGHTLPSVAGLSLGL